MKNMGLNRFLLAILSVFGLTRTVPFKTDEKCLKAPIVENFDLEKMIGYWYMQEIADNEMVLRRCLHYILTTDHKKSGAVMSLRPVYVGKSEDGTVHEHQIGKTAAFLCEWKGGLRTAWAVATDYNSYCLYYLCLPEEKDKGIMFASTRAKIPKKGVMEKIHGILESLGYNTSKSHLHNVDHNGCV